MSLENLHIAIFIYSMGDGGAERVAANLANRWISLGWKVTLITLASKDKDLFELNPEIERISLDRSSESYSIFSGILHNFERIYALRKLLKKINPDIVLGKMTTANILLGLAAWGLPHTKTVGAEHTYPGRKILSLFWEMLRKVSYGLLDCVTVLTCEGESWIKKHTFAKNVVVIPNAVNYPLSIKEPHVLPLKTLFPERNYLLAAGRLVPVKGFNVLIDAFSKLSGQFPDWDLIIIGEGPLRKEMTEQISQADLLNRVFLPGWVGNISEWYQNSDIFVLSSQFEGFPMSLVEAMSYKMCAVSFDCDTGPRDIIDNNVNGSLVKKGDVAELVQALAHLMGNDELRKQYAEQAAKVTTKFSVARIEGLWQALFTELLKK
jgi:glycosyltransferase involved in cell wall biosynthesis